jgi:S-adenosylmethionine-diacylglycerol 3-amino-3-carboxypropyl transferase
MIRDKAFQAAFRKMFVYNILFEDAEVDERYLDLDEDSTVLSISAAGCGVAGMMSRNIRSLDAVDINENHLALAALKTTAATRLFPYSTYYDLLGRGWAPDPKRIFARIQDDLPEFARKYWKRHTDRFERSLYREGLTAQVLGGLRYLTGLDDSWLRWMAELDADARQQAVEDWMGPVLRSKPVRMMLESPLQLLALGINYTQRDRLLAAEQSELVDYFMTHLKRVAATDIHTNWFAWLVVAGHYNHDREDAVPPYLREDRWERSQQARTETRWHHGNLFDVLAAAGPNTWSHYTFCDAPDWMPPNVQHQLLGEVLRTARPGAIVLRRSVEDDCIIESAGMTDRFKRLDISERATIEDRSRQYRRVDFYEVQA